MSALENSDAQDGFRQDVRVWLSDNFPASLLGRQGEFMSIDDLPPADDDFEAWRAAMGDKGWGTPQWPAAYGGGGLDKAQARVLRQEMDAHGAWSPIGGMGVMMFGPTLLEYGSEEQKQRHIPSICQGQIRWCQGYSEPGAGSDLASLRTKCEDMGDHYLVNGQKVWTSGGQVADWCFALVRTDTSHKHFGISFILIDMKTEGVEVRPIKMIMGSSPFCETFFTNVKVPKENLVGELRQGWTIGKRLLQHERSGISGGDGGRANKTFLADAAKETRGVDATGRLTDSDLRSRLISLEMRQVAFGQTAMRVRDESREGGVSAVTSILKNVATALNQSRDEMRIEILGMEGLGWEGEGFEERDLGATRRWLWNKASSVYGGSSEIQNNVVAKRILGMADNT
jgi:alkylation response protein AidB-like acyl-CoA dehydrogenase